MITWPSHKAYRSNCWSDYQKIDTKLSQMLSPIFIISLYKSNLNDSSNIYILCQTVEQDIFLHLYNWYLQGTSCLWDWVMNKMHKLLQQLVLYPISEKIVGKSLQDTSISLVYISYIHPMWCLSPIILYILNYHILKPS